MNLSWDSVTAIGTCLGAVATSCACIIALYQTRLSVKKRIKQIIHDNMVIINGNDDNTYCDICIYNIGNRIINIRGVGYKSSKKKSYAFINPSYVSDGHITPF